MGKVVEGAIIAAAIYFTGGLAAMYLPNALMTASFLSGYFTVVNSLAVNAFLSGVSAQLRGKSRGARAETGVEYVGTVEPRRIIYGQLLVAGMHTIPPLSSGDNNKYTHAVLTVAGHEVHDITDVYFGLDKINDADIGSITGTANDGKVSAGTYQDKAWIRRYLGTPTDSSDHILNTAFAAWTSDHDGKGVAKVAVQLELDEEVFKNGREECLFMVFGKKVYDPRLDSTNGGSGSHRFTDPTTWEYSQNPALCLADYLMDDVLGLGDDPTRIDWGMVSDAADICDELVDVPTGATQARYTCNIALLATTPYERNIEALTACMLGSCLYSGGKWRIRAGAWEVPSFEINAQNIMNGGIETATAYPYKERWNGIRGSYVDPDSRYQPDEFPPTQDDDYVTEDGESVFKDVQMVGCTNVYEAQRNAIMLVRKSRNRRSAVIQCDLSMWKVRPGDTGIVTLAELGWTNKTVRCEGWKFNPAGTIEVAVREELSSDWDDPIEADYLTPTAITAPAPVYFTPSAVSALTTEGETHGITVKWTPPVLVTTGSRYQLFMHTSDTPFASASLVWEGDATSAFVERGDDYDEVYFWVRVVTADGVAGPEYPTSTDGIAGAAKRSGTGNIDEDAVNEPHYAQATNVIITQLVSTPTINIQAAASVTFTPDVDCTVRAIATGTYSCIPVGASPFSTFVQIGLNTSTTPTWVYDIEIPDGQTVRLPFSITQDLSVTGGVSATVRVGAAKSFSGDTLVIESVDLSVVEIKR